MYDSASRVLTGTSDDAPSQHLASAYGHSAVSTALEDAASFGCWWFDPHSSTMVVSATAARYLNVHIGRSMVLDDCFIHVLADDVLPLIKYLSAPTEPASSIEFRVISPKDGMRWLRMTALPPDPPHSRRRTGIVMDTTTTIHAAMRERLGFELTGFLVGSHTLSDAVTNVIQLICKNLGWDWGAYWAMDQSPQSGQQLACKYFWHRPELDLGTFGRASAALSLSPGEGLVGSVWQSGQPGWVEDMRDDPRFAQRTNDRECRLGSGYVFPVTYVSADGQTHSPGVLEFYSCLSRQAEAQLPMLSASIGAFIAQMDQRLEHQATILYLAQVDELTALSNRSHFYDLLNRAVCAASESCSSFGLIFIDLDRFKPINDAFGHEAGNLVLREFAQRLQAIAPTGASVGRIGGDEFAMLVPGDAMDAVRSITDRILKAACTPFMFEDVEMTVSASVGVSTYPQCGNTSAALLQSADAAMYRIKNHGRNGCHFFSVNSPNALAQQQSSVAQRLTLETELHHALQDQELFLVYQPIINIVHQRLDGVEALLRWRRADGSLVPPDVFIPIAEESHLIAQIGKWVVAQACRDLAGLRAAGLKDVIAHVNMAASEFANSGLPSELMAQLDAYDLLPTDLSLELTEGMLMKRPDQVIPVMRALRQLGFGISLDDFGMGHSSLAMLKNLPISSLKIDRSFVRDLSHQRNDRAIVKTIVDLGHHMGLEVIAEGVETAPQLAILQQSGCVLIQGYLLDRPMGIAELLAKYPASALTP